MPAENTGRIERFTIFSLRSTVIKPALVLSSALVLSQPLAALESTKQAFNIESQTLPEALLEFSRQSGQALLLPALKNIPRHSRALMAEMSHFVALSFLLEGTGLVFKEVAGRGIVVVPASTPPETIATIQARDIKDFEALPLLEEIVVTGSKRLTALQDTPMTITALNSMALENYGVNDVFDLSALVPSLQTSRNGDHSAPLLYIRGIGSDNYTEAGDPGIASHVDGIYSSRSQGSAILLYDLERVEVLRGPQGTLFGRNSTGGVINYHSKKPTDSFASKFKLTLGDYQRRAVQGMVNVPLSERWAIRFAAAQDQAEGFIEFDERSISSKASQRYNNTDLSAWRLSSRFDINENASWWLSVENFRDQGTGFESLIDYDSPLLIDTLGHVDLETQSYRSRLDWALNDAVSLSYIAGYSTINHAQDWDGDRTGSLGSKTNQLEYHQSNTTVWSEHRSYQHEVQFKNSDENDVRWLLAYFDFAEKNGIAAYIIAKTDNGFVEQSTVKFMQYMK